MNYKDHILSQINNSSTTNEQLSIVIDECKTIIHLYSNIHSFITDGKLDSIPIDYKYLKINEILTIDINSNGTYIQFHLQTDVNTSHIFCYSNKLNWNKRTVDQNETEIKCLL